MLGKDDRCICKVDSARFKKNLTTSVLSTLGCLFSAPEVELDPSLSDYISISCCYHRVATNISFFTNTVRLA